MPSFDHIQSYMAGVWHLMNGRPEGVRSLDLTADGFWNSFFAVVIALPALFVGWVSLANEIEGGGAFGMRVTILFRLAIIYLATWIGPLLLFAAVAGPAGLGSRFVPYVVASNWASALFVWFMLPPSLLSLVWPAGAEFASALSLGFLMVTLVFSWRLTNSVIAMGPAVATAVFAGMFIASLAILLTLQPLFGLSLPA